MAYTVNIQLTQYTIPDHMMDAIALYIDHHIPPGGFLTAVICNDLREAVGQADSQNINLLPAYVSYFYNEAPSDCWGSRERMTAWLAKRNMDCEIEEATHEAQ